MKSSFTKPCFFSFLFCSFFSFTQSQTIGTFNSVQPTAQTQNLVLPATHTFQRIIRSGDALSSGGTLGGSLDFTGYVPINGSSTNGYLSISSETAPAECAVLSLSFNTANKLWEITNGGKVTLPTADLGVCAAFCSGTVTPRNTVIVAEEVTNAGDFNIDGYQDLGWLIEIDPGTRTVINQDGAGGADKLWAMGRSAHENVTIKSDGTVAYWGADAPTTGYIYKFIPTVPGNFSAGTLYALQTTASLGTGTWQQISNTTQSDRNNTVSLSTAAGAYNFNGVEDMEISPDNKVYFAAKAGGIVYRFRDLGASVEGLEVFVASTDYDVDGAGPFAPEPYGIGNDNLAFDSEGNLWVLQDGSRNHIWVVGTTHTASTPDIRLFATTPVGSEPTGITFSPDYKFMFLSFQHPSTSNTAAQTDAAGAAVVFNTHTTIVIARKEFLGINSILPVRFTGFNLNQNRASIDITWQVEDAQNHSYFDIERSTDGIHFDKIGRVSDAITNGNKNSYSYSDHNFPQTELLLYRIKQCDNNGSCYYSAIRQIQISPDKKLSLFPVPVRNVLNVRYTSTASAIRITIVNSAGVTVYAGKKVINSGSTLFTINTQKMAAGKYVLVMEDGSMKSVQAFDKL
ncbi:MAG TPA: alkaline phosphatase PhoX [Chitinophagaceae bacterium]|nr:alkaline phosphatase PhoX [Chitinophagaceae bacterium]